MHQAKQTAGHQPVGPGSRPSETTAGAKKDDVTWTSRAEIRCRLGIQAAGVATHPTEITHRCTVMQDERGGPGNHGGMLRQYFCLCLCLRADRGSRHLAPPGEIRLVIARPEVAAGTLIKTWKHGPLQVSLDHLRPVPLAWAKRHHQAGLSLARAAGPSQWEAPAVQWEGSAVRLPPISQASTFSH